MFDVMGGGGREDRAGSYNANYNASCQTLACK